MNGAGCLIVLPDKMWAALTGWFVDHGAGVCKVEVPVRQYGRWVDYIDIQVKAAVAASLTDHGLDHGLCLGAIWTSRWLSCQFFRSTSA